MWAVLNNAPGDLRKAPQGTSLIEVGSAYSTNSCLPWFPHLSKWQLDLPSCSGHGHAVVLDAFLPLSCLV